MKTVLIIQARLGSNRLPRKILKPIMGRPVLYYLMERVKFLTQVDSIIIATSINPRDDELVEFAIKNSINIFRGDEEDVLSRFYHAATFYDANIVVRCNSDCPLLDPLIVDEIIKEFKSNIDSIDYLSNILEPSYPVGMHTEVFTYEALSRAFLDAKDLAEREHVTPYIYRRPNLFRLKNRLLDVDLSSHRWTLDYEEDFDLIKKILTNIYHKNPKFTMEDVIKLVNTNPEWKYINSHIYKNGTV